MAKTPTEAEVAKRQRLLAELLVQGGERRLGLAGMARELAQPHREPERRSTNFDPTGDPVPWSKTTISNDIKALKKAWLAQAAAQIASQKALQLETLLYLRDVALTPDKRGRISLDNRAEARQIVAAIGKLLGTDSDQVQLYEQVSTKMALAVNRLSAEFAGEPALRRRVLSALSGSEKILN